MGNGTVRPVVGIGSSTTDHGKVNDSVVSIKTSCRRGGCGKQERTCWLSKVVVPLGSTPVEVGYLKGIESSGEVVNGVGRSAIGPRKEVGRSPTAYTNGDATIAKVKARNGVKGSGNVYGGSGLIDVGRGVVGTPVGIGYGNGIEPNR